MKRIFIWAKRYFGKYLIKFWPGPHLLNIKFSFLNLLSNLSAGSYLNILFQMKSFGEICARSNLSVGSHLGLLPQHRLSLLLSELKQKTLRKLWRIWALRAPTSSWQPFRLRPSRPSRKKGLAIQKMLAINPTKLVEKSKKSCHEIQKKW